jgi:hypothetical protein
VLDCEITAVILFSVGKRYTVNMTTTVLAHFDGKQALVLDEPVNLPVGTPLRIHVETIVESTLYSPDTKFLQPLLFPEDAVVAKQWIDDPEANLENS